MDKKRFAIQLGATMSCDKWSGLLLSGGSIKSCGIVPPHLTHNKYREKKITAEHRSYQYKVYIAVALKLATYVSKMFITNCKSDPFPCENPKFL